MSTAEFSPLPRKVRPLKYRLTLAPDLAQCIFRGEETIEIEVIQPTPEIVLTTAEIEVQFASVVRGDGAAVAAERIDYDSSVDTVKLLFSAPLLPGQAQLALQFTGELNDRLQGFYRSTYHTPDGE